MISEPWQKQRRKLFRVFSAITIFISIFAFHGAQTRMQDLIIGHDERKQQESFGFEAPVSSSSTPSVAGSSVSYHDVEGESEDRCSYYLIYLIVSISIIFTTLIISIQGGCSQATVKIICAALLVFMSSKFNVYLDDCITNENNNQIKAFNNHHQHIFVATRENSPWVDTYSPDPQSQSAFVKDQQRDLPLNVTKHHQNLHQTQQQSTQLNLNKISQNIRISFQLHHPSQVDYPDKFEATIKYFCRGPHSEAERAPLPPSLIPTTILNFTTSVSMDLKIAFVGDSVVGQLAQAWDATLLGIEGAERYDGAGNEDNEEYYSSEIIDNLRSIGRSFQNGPDKSWNHVCLSTSAPVRGGGVSAYWRVTHLMTDQSRRETQRCSDNMKNWGLDSVNELLDYKYLDPAEIKKNQNQTSETKFYLKNLGWSKDIQTILNDKHRLFKTGRFDAVVFRAPYGWIRLGTITRERIIEAILLCSRYLGADTIIIITLSLNNNVIRLPKDWEGIQRVNQVMRDIAREWTPGEGGIRRILIQEFGNFTNQILWMNAKHIGLNITVPDFSQSDRWEVEGGNIITEPIPMESYWKPAISMVCDQPPPPGSQDCPRNAISPDGTHWCVQTVGPRFSASLACLLGCAYNGDGENIVLGGKNNMSFDGEFANDGGETKLRNCEQECNDQFMSIAPVNEKWIGNGMTLFSKVE